MFNFLLDIVGDLTVPDNRLHIDISTTEKVIAILAPILIILVFTYVIIKEVKKNNKK